MKFYNYLLSLSVCLFILSSCTNSRIKDRPDWGSFFEEQGVEGCFELYDNNKEIAYYYDKERCTKQLPPYSIYEVFQSLVALESDQIPNEQYVIKWDGKSYENKAWNQDLNLVNAFKNDAKPYFDQLNIIIGNNTLQSYLDTVHFGNKNKNNIKISSDELVGFMKMLYHDEIPSFNDRSQRIVKGLMLQDEGKNYQLYYKSNAAETDAPIKWMVGFVEIIVSSKNPETKLIDNIPHPYFFALNFDWKENTADALTIQKNILAKILKDLNIIMEK